MISENRNLYLVGFSGTGKTTVGKLVAADLGRPFVDMDETIAERLTLTIPSIFARFGEARFRDEETLLTQELCERRGIVVATGGGVLLNRRNAERLRASGLLVALRATPETIDKRLAAVEPRPLLDADDKLARIRELKAQRKLLYDSIGIQIRTDDLTPRQVADRVLAVVKATD